MLYQILDTFKGRMGYSAVAAFVVHMGILALSIGRRKAVCTIGDKIENKRRVALALKNYGLE